MHTALGQRDDDRGGGEVQQHAVRHGAEQRAPERGARVRAQHEQAAAVVVLHEHLGVGMALHRAAARVECHHCGHAEGVPAACPNCASVSVARHGAGTERLEHELTELLDTRPSWGGGKVNATSLLLEPLTEPESAQLLHNLMGDGALAEEARTAA